MDELREEDEKQCDGRDEERHHTRNGEEGKAKLKG